MYARIISVNFILIVTCLSVANSCRCASPGTNQERFCTSNIAVLAYVYDGGKTGGSYKEYDVLINSVKRDADNVIPDNYQTPFSAKVRTTISSASCNVPITRDNTYLFTSTSLDFGQTPPIMWVNSCSWNQQTSEISKSDLEGLDNWEC